LRRLIEREFGKEETLFPRTRRLKADYRDLLQKAVFANFSLKIDFESLQKRLVLERGKTQLPYMVWSAGQRELVPLLLGLYWLMPPTAISKRKDIDWVIIEEPEMGLHPQAISVLLLVVLELLTRGYRACLSTHSPQVLELVWALEALRSNKGTPTELLSIFHVEPTQALTAMAAKALRKKSKVYYFTKGGVVSDITGLELGDHRADMATWGGLLDFSERANAAVAKAAANS
ncbi:MAG TPA: AAA family ATPase, partial [Reyranella sp.]|nr:AAA family ATPase [Reyranella sp.]